MDHQYGRRGSRIRRQVLAGALSMLALGGCYVAPDIDPLSVEAEIRVDPHVTAVSTTYSPENFTQNGLLTVTIRVPDHGSVIDAYDDVGPVSPRFRRRPGTTG